MRRATLALYMGSAASHACEGRERCCGEQVSGAGGGLGQMNLEDRAAKGGGVWGAYDAAESVGGTGVVTREVERHRGRRRRPRVNAIKGVYF